jgi:two-component system, NtrC family, sensor histidine kinase KinB
MVAQFYPALKPALGASPSPPLATTGQAQAALQKPLPRRKGQRLACRPLAPDEGLPARPWAEAAFSACPDPTLLFSTDGRLRASNPAARRWIAQGDAPPALPPEVAAALQAVPHGGPDYRPGSFERALLLRVDGGQERFFLPHIFGLRDEAGQVFGAALALHDVTLFRQSDRLKTDLVATVSHELKDPLTSVRMGLHLLAEERLGPLTPKQRELVLAAREDAERLLGMTNHLLDLAWLEAGQARRHTERVEVAALIEAVVKEAGPFVTSRGQRLAVKVAPEVPPVAVEPRRIRHVFSNLLSNAVKHSRPGDVITLKAEAVDHRVRFSVIDQGPGIPAEHQPRLFERFFRVPGTGREGAGLGLAIAKQIVTAHGGWIGVRSAPGQGAEFFFELPQAGAAR